MSSYFAEKLDLFTLAIARVREELVLPDIFNDVLFDKNLSTSVEVGAGRRRVLVEPRFPLWLRRVNVHFQISGDLRTEIQTRNFAIQNTCPSLDFEAGSANLSCSPSKIYNFGARKVKSIEYQDIEAFGDQGELKMLSYLK